MFHERSGSLQPARFVPTVIADFLRAGKLLGIKERETSIRCPLEKTIRNYVYLWEEERVGGGRKMKQI